MTKKEEHLENLSEIRNLMERSSRFISLSGLSGVSAGLIALIGAAVAFFYLDYDQRYFDINSFFINQLYIKLHYSIYFLLIDGLAVLILALTAGIFFTTRKARKNSLPIWDNTAKRLLVNLFIPLVAGGAFCLILFYHKIIFLIAPATLLFYGLSLLNASKYTLHDIRYLGISEIILGLLAAFFVGYGLLFWAIGFGILHIIYGGVMYFKYEK